MHTFSHPAEETPLLHHCVITNIVIIHVSWWQTQTHRISEVHWEGWQNNNYVSWASLKSHWPPIFTEIFISGLWVILKPLLCHPYIIIKPWCVCAIAQPFSVRSDSTVSTPSTAAGFIVWAGCFKLIPALDQLCSSLSSTLHFRPLLCQTVTSTT